MNAPFSRDEGGILHAEELPLTSLAERYGTPTFIYSRSDFEQRYQALSAALGDLRHRLCYAVKANANLSVLRTFVELGAGFDIVSAGELERVIVAGGDPSSVLFSGVGKRTEEIDYALKLGIGCFNVESAQELGRLSSRAKLLDRRAPISLRVNPNVDAATHPYISTGLKNNKFGVPEEEALALYRTAAQDPALKIVGIDCHIGSQLTSPGPLLDALQQLLRLVDSLAAEGIELQHIDLGGGLGVRYRTEQPFDINAYGTALNEALTGRSQTLLLEPGRFLVANGGVLLTRVQYLKPGAEVDAKNFAVIDAAMNDLLRPALYQAEHEVTRVIADGGAEERCWDIVGPICESGDFLALDRTLALEVGDLLAIHGAGAYGMALSSNYNSRSRAAELLVKGAEAEEIRQRENVRDQFALELKGLARVRSTGP